MLIKGCSEYAANFEKLITRIGGLKRLSFQNFALKYCSPLIAPKLGVEKLEFWDCELQDFSLMKFLETNTDLKHLMIANTKVEGLKMII